jgi:hypothetical protein
MKKLVLVVVAMLFVAVPMFAAEQGSDQVVISLTIAAGTTVTPNLNDTVALTAGLTGTNNTASAGTITLASNVGATWYFTIESLQTSPGNKGKMVSGSNTFDYTVSLGNLSQVSLTGATPQVGTITTPATGSTTYTLTIHYGATDTLTAGTYTDTVKVTFYDSDPS